MIDREERLQLEIPCPDAAPRPCAAADKGAGRRLPSVVIDGEDEGDDGGAVQFDI